MEVEVKIDNERVKAELENETGTIGQEFKNYQEFKQAFDRTIKKAEESFVEIGYMLRVAECTDFIHEAGYKNREEFAKAEYGIDSSQASRFININKMFSEGGNSKYLKKEYQDFGVAKLGIMLTLPETINEELSPNYSKSEIKEIKEEIEQEKEISEIEVWMEGEKEEQKTLETTLEKAVHQMGHDNPELFEKLWEIILTVAAGMEARTEQVTNRLTEILAPQGEAIYSVRVQGTGRLMLSVKSKDSVIKLINVRTEEKESHNVWDILDILWHLNQNAGSSGKESWEAIYGETFPEPKKEEVAPVQPTKQEKKPAPKKESKVIKAKVEQKEETPVKEEPKTEETTVVEEPETEEEKTAPEESKEEKITEEKETINENEQTEHEKEDEQEPAEETENGENVENTPREDHFGESERGEDSSSENEEVEPEKTDDIEEILSPKGFQKRAQELTDEIFELINVDVECLDLKGMKKLKYAKTKAYTLAATISQMIDRLEEEPGR